MLEELQDLAIFLANNGNTYNPPANAPDPTSAVASPSAPPQDISSSADSWSTMDDRCRFSGRSIGLLPELVSPPWQGHTWFDPRSPPPRSRNARPRQRLSQQRLVLHGVEVVSRVRS